MRCSGASYANITGANMTRKERDTLEYRQWLASVMLGSFPPGPDEEAMQHDRKLTQAYIREAKP